MDGSESSSITDLKEIVREQSLETEDSGCAASSTNGNGHIANGNGHSNGSEATTKTSGVEDVILELDTLNGGINNEVEDRNGDEDVTVQLLGSCLPAAAAAFSAPCADSPARSRNASGSKWTAKKVKKLLSMIEGNRSLSSQADFDQLLALCSIACFFTDPESGDTALHLAINDGLVYAAEYLIENVNTEYLSAENAKGDSALHFAVKKNLPGIVKMVLLKAPRGVELRANCYGYTPPQVAAFLRQQSCLEELVRHNDGLRTTRVGERDTLLHVACKSIYVEYIEYRNTLDSSDLTSSALRQQAARLAELREKGVKLVDLLLSPDHDPDDLTTAQEQSLGSVLHYFALLDHADGIRRIASIASIVPKKLFLLDSANDLGMTPLHVSCLLKAKSAGTELLRLGASARARCQDEKTPLHYLLEEGVTETNLNLVQTLVEELLLKGADPIASDHPQEDYDTDERTPLYYAIQTKFETLIRQILKHVPRSWLAENQIRWREAFILLCGTCDDELLISDLMQRGRNILLGTVGCMPLFEAMKTDRALSTYFNALTRVAPEVLARVGDGSESEHWKYFLNSHINCAAKERRHDILRLGLSAIRDVDVAHAILVNETAADASDKKTALQCAVENKDPIAITEILHHEHRFHDNFRAGLVCLKRQLDCDSYLKWTLDTFRKMYPNKSKAEKYVLPVWKGMTHIFIFLLGLFDFGFDIYFAREFYKSAFSNNASLDQGEINELHNDPHPSTEHCQDVTLAPEDYEMMFYSQLVLLSAPVVCSLIIAVIFTLRSELDRLGVGQKLLAFSSYLFLPISTAYYTYKHKRARRKSKFRSQLRRRQFLLAIVHVVESGIESSGQIVLQCWLLTSHLRPPPADSLAKIVFSLLFLVVAMSRQQSAFKKGAVGISWPLVVSLCSQVVARVAAVTVAMYAFRTQYALAYIFGSHFACVAAIKLLFEQTTTGTIPWSVSLGMTCLNVVTSGLVNIRVPAVTLPAVEVDKKEGKKKRRRDDDVDEVDGAGSGSDTPADGEDNSPNSDVQLGDEEDDYLAASRRGPGHERSTLVEQCLYFGVSFAINAATLIVAWQTPPARCLPMLTIFVAMCIISLLAWVCHAVYYVGSGHPWTDLNGPTLESRRHYAIHYRLLRRLRRFLCPPCNPL